MRRAWDVVGKENAKQLNAASTGPVCEAAVGVRRVIDQTFWRHCQACGAESATGRRVDDDPCFFCREPLEPLDLPYGDNKRKLAPEPQAQGAGADEAGKRISKREEEEGAATPTGDRECRLSRFLPVVRTCVCVWRWLDCDAFVCYSSSKKKGRFMFARPSFHLDANCVHGAINAETAAEVLAFVHDLPDEAWGKVKPCSKDRTRIKYGPHERFGGVEIPPLLRRMGEEAIEAVRDRVPRAAWDTFSIDTLVLNKYAATQGVAAHPDRGPWKPFVVGVTLADDPHGKSSVMTFCDDKPANRLVLATPHRSVYVFHDRAYTGAKHARRPCPVYQRGNVYSFTYRSFAE
jgi:hypothetical protein